VANSSIKPIDWQVLRNWCASLNLDRLLFSRFGCNTPIPDSIRQIDHLCISGGEATNFFDISRDVFLPALEHNSDDESFIPLIVSHKHGVQIRNMFGSIHTKLNGTNSIAGNATIAIGGWKVLVYAPIINILRQSFFDWRKIPKSKKTLKTGWISIDNAGPRLFDNWIYFAGKLRIEVKRVEAISSQVAAQIVMRAGILELPTLLKVNPSFHFNVSYLLS